MLPLLARASDRLLARVEALPDDAFSEPSALPGWSRAHVVAHLALNGEGLAAALAGAAVGKDVAMYRSEEARDGDIDDLAARPPAEIRTRLNAAVRGFAGAFSLVPDPAWETAIHRLPGSEHTFAAADTVGMRLCEVEIHHADLAAGYTRDDWEPDFARHLVGIATGRQRTPMVLRATDLDETWTTDDGHGPEVSGSAADLGWWLAGRGGEERLRVSGGSMPTIGDW